MFHGSSCLGDLLEVGAPAAVAIAASAIKPACGILRNPRANVDGPQAIETECLGWAATAQDPARRISSAT
eukprot:1174243-Pyramimonas_sp.AAC.1